METNSKKMMEALPDFQEMLTLVEEVKKDNIAKMQLEAKIKEIESQNFRKIMTEEAHFNKGKPVAVSYYNEAYKFTGLNDNLLPLRKALLEISAEIDQKKATYDIYKEMLDMFRTLVYQEKGMV